MLLLYTVYCWYLSHTVHDCCVHRFIWKPMTVVGLRLFIMFNSHSGRLKTYFYTCMLMSHYRLNRTGLTHLPWTGGIFTRLRLSTPVITCASHCRARPLSALVYRHPQNWYHELYIYIRRGSSSTLPSSRGLGPRAHIFSLCISRVKNLTFMTTFWLRCFDAWFDFLEPFKKYLALVSLAKIPAFFSRGVNPKWPPAPILHFFFDILKLQIWINTLFRLIRPQGIHFWRQFVLKYISDPKIQDGRQVWMENPFF